LGHGDSVRDLGGSVRCVGFAECREIKKLRTILDERFENTDEE
jgi:hypothetical protein